MSLTPRGVPISALDGTETVEVNNGGPLPTTATTQQIADLASLTSDNETISSLTTVGAGTITAAMVVGGILSRGGAQAGAAFTDTTATAAAIIAALPDGAPVGTTFGFTYENNTNGEATLAAGVGVTLSGNVIIPPNTFGIYLLNKTGAAAVSFTFMYGAPVAPLAPVKVSNDSVTNSATFNVSGFVNAQLAVITATGTNPVLPKAPPAAQIIAAMANAQVGLTTQVLIRNSVSGASFTLTGFAGTAVSNGSIGTGKARLFAMSIPTLNSVNLTGLTETDL